MSKTIGLVATLAAFAALVATGTASAGDNTPTACGGRQVVNVVYTLVNDYDSNTHGTAWANDTIKRHLKVFDLGGGSYCATVEDTGSFVTFAADSPNGTGTVSAGITGRIKGGYTTTEFTGTFDPSYATHGNLGTFDLQCTSAYDCPGAHPTFLSYFGSTSGADLASWAWSYHTAQNGDLLQSSTLGYVGDIAG